MTRTLHLQNNTWKLLLTVLFFTVFIFLIISSSIGSPPYSTLIKRYGLHKKPVEVENLTKGIVVDLPQGIKNPEEKKNYYSKMTKIENLGGKIVFNSPKNSHFYMDVPAENYSTIVKELKKMKYKVRDELVFKPSLNESLNAISAPYVWIEGGQTYTLTGANKVIAILDTGIDADHPDLNDLDDDPSTYDPKVIEWRDSIEIVDNGNYTSTVPYDIDGHGTLVASIAAGTGEASSGKFKGVAPGAKLMVARVCKAEIRVAGGEIIKVVTCRERYMEDALQWAIDNCPDVISMSLGSEVEDRTVCTDISSGINNLISDAISSDIAVVAAAGNSGPYLSINNPYMGWFGAIDHPACIEDVIAVGMTYKKDYSSYEFGTDLQEVLLVTSRIHVIIEINGEVVKDSEWEAFNGMIDKYYMKFGFDEAFSPSSWPATVKIKFEGMERNIKCHAFTGCFVDYEKWWPGDESKGDDFWEDEMTFEKGSNIVVQFSAWPIVEEWSGSWGWYGYHNYFAEFDDYNYYDVYYNIFNDTNKLRDVVPFWSGRDDPLIIDAIVKPDLVAPGYLLCAANSSEASWSGEDLCGNDKYTTFMGTSAATPHVSGTIALLKEAEPYANRTEIWEALTTTTDRLCKGNVYSTGWYLCEIWKGEGYGRLNVENAVDFITDCQLKPSYDSDGGDKPKVRGTCYDYTYWSGDSCTGTQYNEYCSGDYVYEYYADGQECKGYWKNCKDYGSNYVCSNGRCKYSGGSNGGGGGCGLRCLMEAW